MLLNLNCLPVPFYNIIVFTLSLIDRLPNFFTIFCSSDKCNDCFSNCCPLDVKPVYWFARSFSAQKCQNHRRRMYKYRREGKGRHCCQGDRIYSIPCRDSYFTPGWYEEKDELDHYDIKKRTHCTRIIDEKDEFILFSNRPGANSQRGRESNKFCPPNSNDDLCINLSFMVRILVFPTFPCSFFCLPSWWIMAGVIERIDMLIVIYLS